MNVMIDIPESLYTSLKERPATHAENLALYEYITNGIPLPKGHGDLIDKEELKENINGWYAFMKDVCKQPYMTLKQEEIIGKIDIMTPIIEADESEGHINDI